VRGLDTNVLLRYLMADDPEQSPVARSLFEKAENTGDRFFLSLVVLCELCWTLRGRPFSLDRSGISGLVGKLLETRLFEVQERDSVRRALADYQGGRADFADYLIGWLNRSAGSSDTVTFDRKLDGAEGFSILSPETSA
jgi:predicted nucleic-acid-binding protein